MVQVFRCVGLAELLDGCGFIGSLHAALIWCEVQGLESISEIREIGWMGDLVESLPLTPQQKKLLLVRITTVCPPLLPTYPRALPCNAPLARSPVLSPSRRIAMR